MNIRRLCSDSEHDLYEIVKNENGLFEEFMSGLEALDKKQVASLLKRICRNGLPAKRTHKFNTLGDDTYELKTRGGVRVFCFFGGSLLPKALILCHGIKKPKPKVLRREKKKVAAYREAYLTNGRVIT
jgi:hypothetical protein